jgi:peptidoglycan-associated lipoprotein
MQISRTTKIPAVLLLILGLAACTTNKTGNGGADGAGGGADGAGGASTAAGATGNGVDSQALGGANGGAGSAGAPLSVRVFRFDYDSADVQPGDYNALKAHAQYLKSTPSARIIVGGHTDERGTREYNMALGERRAKSVAAFLSSNGAQPTQLEVVSYGEEKPVSTGESESAWAENRRVELDYRAGRP